MEITQLKKGEAAKIFAPLFCHVTFKRLKMEQMLVEFNGSEQEQSSWKAFAHMHKMAATADQQVKTS